MSILKIYIILYERVVFSLGQLESESYIFFLLIIFLCIYRQNLEMVILEILTLFRKKWRSRNTIVL